MPITWRRYRLPLRQPLRLAKGILTEREGILIRRDLADGAVGWGDAAPLPGFSEETLEEVEAALRDRSPPTPSLAFALSCSQEPWPAELPPVPVNGLWVPDRETLAEAVPRLSRGGFACVKVKVPDGVEDALALLRALPKVSLRLDPNQAWSLEQCLRFWDRLPVDRIAYIEEPFRDVGDYARLWARASVPVALDEHLFHPAACTLAAHPCLVACVLKPTLCGVSSLPRAYPAKPLVLSSAFESAVGLTHLARLAARSVLPCGLDTGQVFARDLVDPLPEIRGGYLRVASGTIQL